MRHLLICPEYPPSHAGGIGTYAHHIAHLLARDGETVHVIGQLWKGADRPLETSHDGRLTVHRVPYLSWRSILPRRRHPKMRSEEARRLFASDYYPQAFSWQAALLAERLVEEEAIDVIEAQEYEAPLYFFQLRRSLGLGATREPPLIIHLHSPTEFILRHNDYPVGHPAFVAARLEGHCVRAADALLSPSRYLADQIEERFSLARNSIEVIRYPIGESSPIDRTPETWRDGLICYVGRLEGRKGVLEWIDAAVAATRQNPSCSFDFIGENVLGDGSLSGEEIIQRRIPPDLKARFRFHGRQPREHLHRFLRRARISVVPSRWDNFPNTCVEAMSSGLPVLTTREGGMAEVVEDGHSGWLAESADEAGLLSALTRALDTSPVTLAEMGREAALRIRKLCDDDDILRRHIAFRRRVASAGANVSCNVPVGAAPRAKRPVHRVAEVGARVGIAVAVATGEAARASGACLVSLRHQTHPPRAVVLVGDEWAEDAAEGWPHETRILRASSGGGAGSRNNRASETVRKAGIMPLGFVFLDTEDRLEASFIARSEAVLERRPEVGLISCWTEQVRGKERYRIRPCPALPYQWLRNDAAPISVFRAEALEGTGPLRPSLPGAFVQWDLANSVLASGWVAVTIPEFLGHHTCREQTESAYPASSRMRCRLLERFPELVERDALSLVLLTGIDPRLRLREGSMNQRERLELLSMLLSRSGSLIGWFLKVVAARLSL